MLPDRNPPQNHNQYYISYAVRKLNLYGHSFIIISRSFVTPEGEERKIVLGSIGFYGPDGSPLTSIFTGSHTIQGAIKSENFILRYSKAIAVISFEITENQAIHVLNMVNRDRYINAPKFDTKKEEPELNEKQSEIFEDAILNQLEGKKLSLKQEAVLGLFTQYEKQSEKTATGGPLFNVRDFNCKKFAVCILREIGINHPFIEEGRFATYYFDRFLKKAAFDQTGNYWESDLNVQPLPEKRKPFPNQYYKIVANKMPVDGAIALLNDYISTKKWVHPKRHYIEIISSALKYIKENKMQFISLESILDYVKSELPYYRDMTGSIQKRLDFLEAYYCAKCAEKEAVHQDNTIKFSK